MLREADAEAAPTSYVALADPGAYLALDREMFVLVRQGRVAMTLDLMPSAELVAGDRVFLSCRSAEDDYLQALDALVPRP